MVQSLTAPLPTTSPDHRAIGILTGLASALAFASSGPLLKPLIEAGWSTGAAASVRMGGAAIVLLPVLILALRRDPGILRRNALIIVGFGATGVAGCQLFYLAAIQRMPVGVALLVQYLAPVLLVALAWIRTRRAPGRLVLLGSAVSIVGLVFVIDIGGATFDALGVLFALGAAVSLGGYFLLSERAGDGLPPLVLAAAGLAVGALFSGGLSLVGVLPFAAPPVDVILGGLTVPWYVPLIWVVLIATALAYGLGVLAVTQIGSRVASFVGLSEVLFAIVIAWLVLDEQPSSVQVIGGALIVAGVVFVRLGTPSTVVPVPNVPVVPSP
ncbi:MAG: DMT family transporter [Microbacterium sp.]|uniref:EamA family transporter n=1 Tax=Microbacterium sp. TaxID=51671 RepID=UPI00272682EC|nr:DMT family transporter [Microbacterium sp.]MDO8382995.1 DMT family transporter [Microbacterium sp.]